MSPTSPQTLARKTSRRPNVAAGSYRERWAQVGPTYFGLSVDHKGSAMRTPKLLIGALTADSSLTCLPLLPVRAAPGLQLWTLSYSSTPAVGLWFHGV